MGKNLKDTEPLKSSKKKPQKNNQTENNYETSSSLKV
jgi:hypothetical protein